jgi:hypothetical protein
MKLLYWMSLMMHWRWLPVVRWNAKELFISHIMAFANRSAQRSLNAKQKGLASCES